MNAIGKSEMICGVDYDKVKEESKVKKVEVAFSVVLFVSAIYGIWQASAIIISIVSLIK